MAPQWVAFSEGTLLSGPVPAACSPSLQDVAVLDVVATVLQEQGQGHCTALLGALEGWLGSQLGVHDLLAVCPQDVS